jgi:hypothetical protein
MLEDSSHCDALPMEHAMCFKGNLAEIVDECPLQQNECPLQQNRVMTADDAAAGYY